GLRELAAQLLDAPGELAALALARRYALGELLGALAAIALEPGHAVLGLDAQLLLGVLALLDPAQLALALGAMRALGLEQLGDAAPFLLGVAKTLLEAGDVAFERLDGGSRGLGTALQCRLAALGRAPRAPFGEEVGLAPAGHGRLFSRPCPRIPTSATGASAESCRPPPPAATCTASSAATPRGTRSATHARRWAPTWS